MTLSEIHIKKFAIVISVLLSLLILCGIILAISKEKKITNRNASKQPNAKIVQEQIVKEKVSKDMENLTEIQKKIESQRGQELAPNQEQVDLSFEQLKEVSAKAGMPEPTPEEVKKQLESLK